MPAPRRLLGLAAFTLAWVACAWGIGRTLPSTLLEAWLLVSGGGWSLAPWLAVTTRPMLCVAALSIAALSLVLLEHLLPLQGRAQHLRRWLLLLLPVALTIWPFIDLGTTVPRHANRWGFYPAFAQSATFRIPEKQRPSIIWQVTTNSEGFRAPEWSLPLPAGDERVLLAGDSFVYGFGIFQTEDLLDRRLEAALARLEPARRPHVLNLAQLPSGLWYGIHVLRAAARELKPQVLILSYIGCSDLEPMELQQIWQGRSARTVDWMRRLQIDNDVMIADERATQGCGPEDSVEMAADLRDDFEALVRDAEALHARLLVWEPLAPEGRSDPLFDPWRKRPAVTFLNWNQDVREPARQRGVVLPERWQDDPTLGIAGDGHPTARANALFADAIAARITERR